MSTGPAGNGTPERTSKEKPTEENLGVTLPVPQAPVVPNPEGSTPLWATVLLGRVQGGKSIDSARQLPGSRVSRETIATYGTQNRNWYRSLMDAQSGALVGSPVTPETIARTRANSIVDRMGDMAMGDLDGVVPRDQIGAGRLVLEVAGAVGSAAQATGSSGVTITGGQTILLLAAMTPDQLRTLAQGTLPAPSTPAP